MYVLIISVKSYSHIIGLNSILLINRHIQQDKDIYGTGSDRKLKVYINHLLKNILKVLIYVNGGSNIHIPVYNLI